MAAPPQVRTHPVVACPGCGSSTRHRRPLGDAELLVCDACGLVHAPEYGDPDDLYVDGYMRGCTRFGYDVTPQRFQRYLARVNQLRMDVITRANGGPGSLLDVGCARGELLGTATARGWQATGVEPVADAANFARAQGHDVRLSRLEQSGLPEGCFDVVSAFHVTEHVPDAAGFLRSLGRWARPGGHVVVEVPNFRSFDRRRNGQSWRGLRQLEHIGHFSPATLRSTFRAAGLEPVRISTPSYVGDPQTLDEALTDLTRGSWAPFLKPLTREVEVTWVEGLENARTHVPTALGWRALRLVEAAYAVAGVGMVVVGVARVP